MYCYLYGVVGGFGSVGSCVGKNQMCHLCGWLKLFLKNEGRQKKIKHEALGCRVGKKSAVKFICRPVVSIIFCQFNGCCVV
jgi:hypothetical protein